MISKVEPGIFEDATFRIFAWWTVVLVMKTIIMSLLTARLRLTKKIFSSPEDTIFGRGATVSYNDPDIERMRRAHLNDLENILPWIISTGFWITTGPEPVFAARLIRIFGISRLLHTFVYAIYPIRQPARFLAFEVGYWITVYQTLATIYHFF